MKGVGMSRRGFTLTEALVVIAILGVLMAMILPAIQHVRAASARLVCANNLRGIGVALHHYHQDHARLPVGNYTARTAPNDPRIMLSWMALILPYVEQNQLWASAVEACALSPDPWRTPPHTPLSRVIAIYRCPLDDRLSAPLTDADGITAAYTSYIGVKGDRKADGVMTWPGIKFAQVVDGLSNTLMVGERPPPDTLQAGVWYPNIWFGDGVYGNFWGPQGSLGLRQAHWADDPCDGPYRFAPGRLENPCDRYHFWSLHPQGAHFLFADCSVRFIRYSAEPMLRSLATRAGGEPPVDLD
jgi:prepilin-type N-terminal cleavage/methylation domain-containing protein/prepilin-type processing-associated H-X9-DG protein